MSYETSSSNLNITDNSCARSEEEISLHSLASSILKKSTKSYLLIFYGKEVGNCQLPGNAACCIYTPSTADALSKLFDEMHKILEARESLPAQDQPESNYDPLIPCVRGLHFVDYEFSQLPDNIGRVFRSITQCTFYKCPELSSLSSTVKQFSSLSSLSARDCHNLTSLSSLSDIPPTMSLQALRINNCGLCITSDLDWEEAMKVLGNTLSNGLVFNITACHRLKRLPTSMKYLKNVLSCLRLESNYNLNYIPDSIYEMNQMVEFQLINCPAIYSLPPSMSRLRDDCKVSITGNDALVEKIRYDIEIEKLKHAKPTSQSSKLYQSMSSSTYFSQNIRKMRTHFHQRRMRQLRTVVRLSVLLRRAKFRANHRIYRPGGVGFLRSRNHFYEMVRLKSVPTRALLDIQKLDCNCLIKHSDW